LAAIILNHIDWQATGHTLARWL